jgi:hypothetical protein
VRFVSGSTINGRPIAQADTSSPPRFTDQSGSFVLEWLLPVVWSRVSIGVERDTFLGAQHSVVSRSLTNAVVGLYPERTIRPGELLETQVVAGLSICGEDGWPCRKVFVDLGGAPVDLEVIPLDGQFGSLFGLVAGGPYASSPQLRLTVNTAEVFIYDTGRVQLRASRPPQ